MCTVTFWPSGRGYGLAMNRDEQRARPASTGPRVHACGAATAAWPADHRGGTWIGLNAAGAAFALVNWYSVARKPGAGSATRGLVVRELLAATDPGHADALAGGLPLDALPPFRVAGFFPGARAVAEWQWDGHRLRRLAHPWAPRQWISSGRDEPGAQAARARVFERMRAAPDAGSAAWLRRLHASHDPEPGPYSTCVHREDAATVSYTEVAWTPGRGLMRHAPGCPCGSSTAPWDVVAVDRAPGGIAVA